MADSGGDYFFESEDFDITQIIRIQAAVRGTLVRKWMEEVKQAFEETFVELEKNTTLGVDWKSELVCYPKVVKAKDRQKNEKNKKIKDTQNRQREESKSQKSTNSRVKNKTCNQTEHKQTDFATRNVSGPFVKVSTDEESENVSEISETVSDSLKFNSVEIQTSFIDVNFQDVPHNSKHNSDRINDQDDNILDDLDVSWKDRVKPFMQNNFGETENVDGLEKDTADLNELHLDLDSDAGSVQSQRSSKGSSRNTARDEQSEKSEQVRKRTETLNDERINKFGTVDRNTERSLNSERSERSQSSSRRRYDQEMSDRDHRSSRSEDQSSRSNSKPSRQSPEYLEKGQPFAKSNQPESEKRSDTDLLSSRSHKSYERDQNFFETEKFSPRGQRSNSSKHSDSRSQKSHRSEKGSEGQLSHRSDRSEGKRHNSNRSEGPVSHRSDKSDDRKSQQSQRSRHNEGHRSQRTVSEEEMHPKQSRASPVAVKTSEMNCLHEDNLIQGRPPLQDSTSLTNVTSVWDSFSSVRESHDTEMPKPLPQDTTQLKELRKNIAMELLWVQQAIDSRKNYLKLKGKM
ncbi:dentin sialophosphoprotein-like [Mercenaria mercenaria]|uniref:dentin sialophosphoprotein-like n=1 Tax=Mercenaria mercenaria TaxID=6596 RepID=UPI00234F0381|nr:dentin sialophosphoprotein-like [Mercenaria mercenaria]